MKKILLITSIIFIQLLPDSLFGQWVSYTEYNPETQLLENGLGCDYWQNYAPYPDLDMMPIKKIRIAYHIMQDENGNGNIPNNSSGIAYLNNIVDLANSKLANLSEPELYLPDGWPSYPPYEWPEETSPYMDDARIQFHLDYIYFHEIEDQWVWDWTNGVASGIVGHIYFNIILTNENLNDLQKYHTLHLIIGGGTNPNVGGMVSGFGSYIGKFISQNGLYPAFLQTPQNIHSPSSNLIHEFGHCAGLSHNFYEEDDPKPQCDDCDDNNPAPHPLLEYDCPLVGTSNNYMDYGPGQSFSQCQLGKMHYNLVSGIVNVAPSLIIDCDIIDEPFTIEEGRDVVWMHNNTMAGNLIIEPGATLTIMCTIRMKEGAKIVVKRGGKLIVDEGTITSACSGLWRGIEVWGNSELSHSPPTNQGMVFVKNGGVIENALTGIKTYRPISDYIDDCVYGYTGGIIVADNAVFRNNRIAVEFLPYNFDRNLSSFKNTEFITDSELPGGFFPDYFVKLSGVRNIDFKACTFSNTLPGLADNPSRGSGIFAADAEVLISAICKYPDPLPIGSPCPDGYLSPSQFNSLYYGVYAVKTGINRKVEIDQAVFYQNYRGILNLGHNFAAITRSEFHVFPEAVQVYPETWGLRMEDADGFMIEENYFKGIQKFDTIFGTGLVIQNSGENPNLVYNNAFETLQYAAFARGMNRNQSDNTGLCFKCNDFDNNTVDIYIHGTRTEGIATHQGADIEEDHTAPAGNIFSREMPFSNFYNETFSYITYFKHWGLPEELIPLNNVPINGVTTSSVPLTEYSKEDSCPSNLGGGAPPIEEMKMMVAGQQSDSLSNELAMYVDDGDTEVLTTDVMMTTQYNAEASYLELMQTAPYLSDTVLKTVIVNEAAFTNPMIRDVMVASPQSGKSDDILDMLEAKSDPMPESMMADIYDGRLIVGGREKLEAELAHWRRERYKAFTNLYRWYSADTSCMYATDSLIALLNAENNAASQYKLAFLYLDRNEPLQAGQTLAAIPASFSLDANALAVHQAYLDLADIWLQILNDSVYFINPGETIISDLMALYNAEQGLPSIYARNILLAAGALEYDPDIILFGSEKRERVYRRSQATETSESRLKLYPNPAKGVLTIEYQTDENTFSAIIAITRIDGGMVMSESLPLSSGSRQLSLESLKAGSYLVQLMLNDKPAAIQRLQIIK